LGPRKRLGETSAQSHDDKVFSMGREEGKRKIVLLPKSAGTVLTGRARGNQEQGGEDVRNKKAGPSGG